MHVLLFDRDEVVLEVMRATLAATGARVSTASSVGEVVRMASEERIDVVATDGMMRKEERCALVIALRTSRSARARATRLVRLQCSAA